MIFGEILHVHVRTSIHGTRDIAGGLTVREDCTDMESMIHDCHPTNRIASNSMPAFDSDQEHARSHMNSTATAINDVSASKRMRVYCSTAIMQ